MIIFYDKENGTIIGTIDGRIHDKRHLEMWVGDKELTDRLVVQWIQEEGSTEFVPDTTQRELLTELEKNPSDIYSYRVDNGQLVAKE